MVDLLAHFEIVRVHRVELFRRDLQAIFQLSHPLLVVADFVRGLVENVGQFNLINP